MVAKSDLVSPWRSPFLLAAFAATDSPSEQLCKAVKCYYSFTNRDTPQQINLTNVNMTERVQAWRKGHIQKGRGLKHLSSFLGYNSVRVIV